MLNPQSRDTADIDLNCRYWQASPHVKIDLTAPFAASEAAMIRRKIIFSSSTRIFRATILGALLGLAACSSTGKTVVDRDRSVQIPRSSTAALTIKSALAKDHRYEKRAVESLMRDIPAKLVQAGVFRQVSTTTTPTAPADYALEITINRLRVITPGGRVMFGFMAGRNNLGVDVVVRSNATRQIVRSFETTGYGASIGWGAQSYGVDDPVREVVNRVVENLR